MFKIWELFSPQFSKNFQNFHAKYYENLKFYNSYGAAAIREERMCELRITN
jgi:hypothetical protein